MKLWCPCEDNLKSDRKLPTLPPGLAHVHAAYAAIHSWLSGTWYHIGHGHCLSVSKVLSPHHKFLLFNVSFLFDTKVALEK